MSLYLLLIPALVGIAFLLSRRCGCKSKTKPAVTTTSQPRNVPQLLDGGINSVDDLREALQVAAALEFGTVPPYLCAEWSIKDQKNPVRAIVHEIVIQEMLHLGLACNMLSAIGGKPKLAAASFVPVYPTNGLPGGVHPGLKVELLPLCQESIATFMAIEYPDAGPIAVGEKRYTIGEFYSAIAEAFVRLKPQFLADAPQVEMPVSAKDELFAIRSVEDALKAIKLICEQGEGTAETPTVPDFDPDQISHYYAFKQIAVGKRLVRGADGKWTFDGPAVPFPEVNQFGSQPQGNESDEFNGILSDLLRTLELSWQKPDEFRNAMQFMFKLRKAGMNLIQRGLRPQFAWKDR